MKKLRRIAVAITGASGVAYGRRLLEALLNNESTEIHLMISPAAAKVFHHEEGAKVDIENFDPRSLKLSQSERLIYHRHDNVAAPPASGSFRVEAMAIVPCSMGCVGALAHGLSDNLIERAADVMIKEKRPLVIVPRETPLSQIHLRNLLTLAEAGVTVMPAAPGFYGKPKSVDEMIDFVVARVLDHLKIENAIGVRWGEK